MARKQEDNKGFLSALLLPPKQRRARLVVGRVLEKFALFILSYTGRGELGEREGVITGKSSLLKIKAVAKKCLAVILAVVW